MKPSKNNIEDYLAWVLSEIRNDNAPIGWEKHKPTAKCLLGTFEINVKSELKKGLKK